MVIFDLGGGTFDVSVLSLDGGVFEVKATGGGQFGVNTAPRPARRTRHSSTSERTSPLAHRNASRTTADTHLGGEDFDNVLLDYCFAQIEETNGLSKAEVDKFRQNGRISRRLRKAAESAKRMLSTVETTMIEVEGLTDDLDVSIELTREKFTELNGELFTRCIDTVR